MVVGVTTNWYYKLVEVSTHDKIYLRIRFKRGFRIKFFNFHVFLHSFNTHKILFSIYLIKYKIKV